MHSTNYTCNLYTPCKLYIYLVIYIYIDLDSEESEYNAYVFYQLLEEQTSHSHTLVEDVKVTKDLAKVGNRSKGSDD